MSRLIDAQPQAVVRGILPDGRIPRASVQVFSGMPVESTCKVTSGRVANEPHCHQDGARIGARLTAPTLRLISNRGFVHSACYRERSPMIEKRGHPSPSQLTASNERRAD